MKFKVGDKIFIRSSALDGIVVSVTELNNEEVPEVLYGLFVYKVYMPEINMIMDGYLEKGLEEGK